MSVKGQKRAGNTGVIALLSGVIVFALAVLVFFYFRSNTSSGESADGPVKQIMPGARTRHKTTSTTVQ